MTASEHIPEYYYFSTEGESIARNSRNSYTNYSKSQRKYGDYEIIEKNYGDHKIFDYIPIQRGSHYIRRQHEKSSSDIQRRNNYESTSVKRRYYTEYDGDEGDDDSEDDTDDDDSDENDNDVEYIRILPKILSPRRKVLISPRRPIIEKIYFYTPDSKTTEYIYPKDRKVENNNVVKYVIRELLPTTKYIEEPQQVQQTIQTDNLPPIEHSPRPTNISRQPSAVRPAPSPSPLPRLPSPPRQPPVEPTNTKNKNQTSRTTVTTNREKLETTNIQKSKDKPQPSLKDVLARNRARRGPKIPKPRREVYEENNYNLPRNRKK